MKKVVYHRYGAAEVLQVSEYNVPKPGNGEVLVKVMAAGVNPVDYKIRNGSLKMLARGRFPRTPGSEISGIVEKNGNGASLFKPGDKVYAMLTMAGGGCSEYINVKEDLLALMPENMAFEEAASVPLAALTSLQALRKLGKIQKGQKVLINGASGGVGIFAVQLAKIFGAEVVGVCSGRNMDFVRHMGADHVINYEVTDFRTIDKSYDVIFDAVGAASYNQCSGILSSEGVYITTMPSPSVFILTALNIFRSHKVYSLLTKPNRKDLNFLTRVIEEGKLKTSLERVLTMDDIVMAHRLSESGRVKGKVVIRMKHY